MTNTNQKLREALSELMSITSIHQKATGNNFAWAEMDFAREALALPTAAPVGEREVIYRCANCKHIYEDPPTKCDCMPEVQWYEQGYASFDGTTLPTQQSPVDGLPVLPDPTYIYHDAEQGEDDLFEFSESGAVDEGCPKCKRLYTADQMRAYALSALSAGYAGWQPIDTAPKVGVLLLCLPVSGTCRAEDRRVYESRWNEDQQTWTSVNGFILLTDATHWMALPPAPAMRKGQL